VSSLPNPAKSSARTACACGSTDIVQPLIESVSAFGVVLAILYVYYFHISFGKFAALCAGIFLLYNPVKSLSKIPMLMQKCMASATNIFDLLKMTSDIQDKPDAVVLTRVQADASRLAHELFLRRWSKAAVEDITLTVEPGKNTRWSAPAVPENASARLSSASTIRKGPHPGGRA